mgnify:CR=1 FL=1
MSVAQASFIVPPGTPGLSQGQKYKKHGIRASHTAEVVLDDVKVPGSCLLGGKDKLDEKLARARDHKSSGKQPAMATFEATRPTVGAQAGDRTLAGAASEVLCFQAALPSATTSSCSPAYPESSLPGRTRPTSERAAERSMSTMSAPQLEDGAPHLELLTDGAQAQLPQQGIR